MSQPTEYFPPFYSNTPVYHLAPEKISQCSIIIQKIRQTDFDTCYTHSSPILSLPLFPTSLFQTSQGNIASASARHPHGEQASDEKAKAQHREQQYYNPIEEGENL